MEIVAFESAEAFEAWLGENHTVSPGIWLKLRKKVPGIVALDYAQALDVALCYGWIDGQKATFDDQRRIQRFTPRGPSSKWSKVNRDMVAVLIEQGASTRLGSQNPNFVTMGRVVGGGHGPHSGDCPTPGGAGAPALRPAGATIPGQPMTWGSREPNRGAARRRPSPGPA